MGETHVQLSGIVAPNLESENPGPLLVADGTLAGKIVGLCLLRYCILAASLICEKWQSLACVILACDLLGV